MQTPTLEQIANVPGVLGAMLCDDFGGVLQSAGDAGMAGVEAAVLAQAAESAATALGHRLALGGCTALTQTCREGVVHIRGTGADRMILIWHRPDTDTGTLERLLASFEPSSTPPPPETRALAPVQSVPAHWDPFSPPPPT